MTQRSDLGLATDERRESARSGGLESPAAGGRGEQLERLDRGGQPQRVGQVQVPDRRVLDEPSRERHVVPGGVVAVHAVGEARALG